MRSAHHWKELPILDFHDGRYVPVEFANADLVLARVAGFDKAVYGLPAEGVKPILFKAPQGEVLVATTKLSQFVTGRYEPVKSWGTVWNWILAWLSPQAPLQWGNSTAAVSSHVRPRPTLARKRRTRSLPAGRGVVQQGED